MAAETQTLNHVSNEDKDAGLFIEGKGDARSTGEYTAEYQEYLRLENEVFVGKVKKKLLRKMDIRVVLPLVIIYLIGYVDRSNIGNARLFGLEKDLNITPFQYNMVLTAFFLTYALFDIPAQIVNKKMGPRRFVSVIMVAFGIITLCTAFSFNLAGIVACRLMLGIFEAGLFPGVIYILSYWYSRWELQTRISVFYAGASGAGAFAGLLAYAIANLDYKLGYRAWRWIFGIEGILTIVVGILGWFMVSEAPADALWLTEEERSYLLLRQRYSAGPVPSTSHFEWKYVRQALMDWKAYVGCVLFFGVTVPTYGVTFALPTIINNLGFSAARAQGMSAPPYIFGCLITIGASVIADRIKQRGVIVTGSFALACVGFAIVMPTAGKSELTGVTLFGIFLLVGGIYMALPPLMAWVANMFEGEVKRGIAISLVPTLGQLGGVIGSNIYLTKEKPFYRTGFSVCLAFCVIGLVASVLLRIALARENARRERIPIEHIREKYTQEELTDLGDKSPLFRYTL